MVGLGLTERSSEAAFALCQCICQLGAPSADWVGVGPSGELAATALGPPPPEDEDEQETKLSWDEEPVELPPEQQVIWSGYRAQARILDLKSIVDTLPKLKICQAKPQRTTTGWTASMIKIKWPRPGPKGCCTAFAFKPTSTSS